MVSPGFVVRRGEVDLYGEVRGEDGAPVLVFLHGLAGYGREWHNIAAAVGSGRRTVVFDQRGHGFSSRRPTDVSRSALVEDVVAVADAVAPGEAISLVGQSLGGHTAFLVAARYPELVDRLVVVEATAGSRDPELPARIDRWLRSWPRPFPSRSDALRFFGGRGATAWVDGLEERPDGLWPRFDDDVLLAALEEVARRDWWEEWSRIQCPTLVVQGESGWLTDDDAGRMRSTAADVAVVTVPDAAHDVHLDNPELLVAALEQFL